MCNMCGEVDCDNGNRCNLGKYLQMPNIQMAIKRVQGYDSTFTARSLGCQQYELYPSGGQRPAWVPGVWNHFQNLESFICPGCGKTFQSGHVDHMTPWRSYIQRELDLGADAQETIPLFVARVLASDPNNLQLLCAQCNWTKGDKTVEGWKQQKNSGSVFYRRRSHSRPRPFVSRQFRKEAYQECLDRKLRMEKQQKERAERVERRSQARLSYFNFDDLGESSF